jgi:phosphomevalonate kinase
LVKLADSQGITYKPCGAGGGDIGIALSTDTDALEKFRSAVSDNDFLLLDLEMAEHGITVKD